MSPSPYVRSTSTLPLGIITLAGTLKKNSLSLHIPLQLKMRLGVKSYITTNTALAVIVASLLIWCLVLHNVFSDEQKQVSGIVAGWQAGS